MEKIITNINLIDSTGMLKSHSEIKIIETEENTYVEISVFYNQKEYTGKGTDHLWVDAFADLQRNLPANVKLACCMTCKHGSMCPFGDFARELHCTKDFKINDKSELIDLFTNDNFYENNKVLCDSYCDDYEPQNKDYFTYNDYRYEMFF